MQMRVRFTAYKQREHINQRLFLLLRFIVRIYVEPISFALHVAFCFNADRVLRADESVSPQRHVGNAYRRDGRSCKLASRIEDPHEPARGPRIINPN